MMYTKFSFVIAWIIISFMSYCPSIQAQNVQNSLDLTLAKKGRPVNRSNGGRRGNCKVTQTVNNKNLTALVAAQGDAVTISDSPTFLFFVPYVSSNPLYARFSLQDDKRSNVIKPILIQLPRIPGVVKVKVNLPSTLEKNKSYRWSFAVICDPEDESNNPGVDGGFMKIIPQFNLTNQLTKKMSQRELAAFYRKEGILLDALAILAEIRFKETAAESDWNNLLEYLGLGMIAPEKVLDCCTVKE